MGDAGFTTYLVDDDPAVLRSITRLLKAGGYKTKSSRRRKNFFPPTIRPFRAAQSSTS